MESSWLFDGVKAFDEIEIIHKSDFFLSKNIFFRSCATCPELPSNICVMVECKSCMTIADEISLKSMK